TINAFVALGCVRRIVLTFAALLAFRIPAAVVGFHLGGTEGAALGLLAAAAVGLVAWHVQASTLLRIAIPALLGCFWRSLCAALPMAPAVLAIVAYAPRTQSTVILVTLAILAGAVVHAATQAALWYAAGRPPGPEQHGLDVLNVLVGRLTNV